MFCVRQRSYPYERKRSYNPLFQWFSLLTKVTCYTNNERMARGSVQSKAMKIGLRVLNAYTSHILPAAADERHLRMLTGDTTNAGDDLACQIIQAEVRKLRSKNDSATKATSSNGTNRDSNPEWIDAPRNRVAGINSGGTDNQKDQPTTRHQL